MTEEDVASYYIPPTGDAAVDAYVAFWRDRIRELAASRISRRILLGVQPNASADAALPETDWTATLTEERR